MSKLLNDISSLIEEVRGPAIRKLINDSYKKLEKHVEWKRLSMKAAEKHPAMWEKFHNDLNNGTVKRVNFDLGNLVKK
jgi:hypothetical protein